MRPPLTFWTDRLFGTNQNETKRSTTTASSSRHESKMRPSFALRRAGLFSGLLAPSLPSAWYYRKRPRPARARAGTAAASATDSAASSSFPRLATACRRGRRPHGRRALGGLASPLPLLICRRQCWGPSRGSVGSRPFTTPEEKKASRARRGPTGSLLGRRRWGAGSDSSVARCSWPISNVSGSWHRPTGSFPTPWTVRGVPSCAGRSISRPPAPRTNVTLYDGPDQTRPDGGPSSPPDLFQPVRKGIGWREHQRADQRARVHTSSSEIKRPDKPALCY